MRILTWVAFLTFLADQATKYYVVHILNLRSLRDIEVFPPYFTLRMAWNDGINFGLFGDSSDLKRWGLIALAVVIVVVVLFMVRRQGGSWLTYVSAGLLVGGALGNVIDRLLYKAVADFINMSCCGIDNPYVFNLADVAIFAGAIGLALFSGPPPAKRKRKRKREKPS